MFTFRKQKREKSHRLGMQYLPYLTPSDAEITIEKLDKVAKTLSDKIKSYRKLFGIFLGWCIFNLIVSLFFNRTRSLSLDAYRMIAEGLRSISTQDFFFVLTLFFDNKLVCVISFAMVIVFGVAFFVRFLKIENVAAADTRVNAYSKFTQTKLQGKAYVVSYKQQVAFLA